MPWVPLEKSRFPLSVTSQHFSSLHICSISQGLMVHATLLSPHWTLCSMVTTKTLSSALSSFAMTRSACILNTTICAQLGDFTGITRANFSETLNLYYSVVSGGSLEASWILVFLEEEEKRHTCDFSNSL